MIHKDRVGEDVGCRWGRGGEWPCWIDILYFHQHNDLTKWLTGEERVTFKYLIIKYMTIAIAFFKCFIYIFIVVIVIT